MYGADLAPVDFQHASDDARKVINKWVKDQTEGKRLHCTGPVSQLSLAVAHTCHNQLQR